MLMLRQLAPLLAAAVLASCSTLPVTKGIDAAATPDSKAGYIGGTFIAWGDDQFAFELIRLGTTGGGTHLLTFSDAPGAKNPTGEGKLQLLAVPPGEYRVAAWVVFRKSKLGEARRTDLPEREPLGAPFSVKPGHVVYLGSFSGHLYVSRALDKIFTEWSVMPREIRADEVPPRLATAYPGFAGAPVECLLCAAPAPDAREEGTPVDRPEDPH